MGLCIGLLGGGGGGGVGIRSPPAIGSASLLPVFGVVTLSPAVGSVSSASTVGFVASLPTFGFVWMSTFGVGKAGGADGRILYESMFGTLRRLRGAGFTGIGVVCCSGGWRRRVVLRVCRSVGSGIRVRGPGRRPGRGGEGGAASSRSWGSSTPSSTAVCAGLSRERATISTPRPGM